MTHRPYHHFKNLHYQAAPLLLAPAWDARSASTSQALGFAAVGTSSAAMAALLGYADGEQLPFPELRYLVSRICASTTLPVSVDLEGGYSRDPAQIAAHIRELASLGVVGINLEDSVGVAGGRQLLEPTGFAETLRTIRTELAQARVEVFLNVRTDTYLLGSANPLPATLLRQQLYEAAGADGLFVPGLTELPAMHDLCRASRLPLNVMAVPGLPAFGELQAAGVRRISLGNFLFEALTTRQRQLSQQIQHDQTCTSLFA
ncbi:isocitrate lyase/PEP mutase family protein [Hymenobacter chitinivorans]|uniref:2-methylisocitrate lyase-like PEP mutase family enzyme n=1 Tax=Hymenobacter chitinivorans DSM 11115 TaxID=1121954 RepID=A0A2M9BQR3_9BACT|nr:isocitrate lyase/phosphoenolpyruvate mutase family protein [Hymenobacter chitinivorans]PJJ60278.1 2-methylisocitrate lyase-like PEP mutase family enzyme [Hymenobacter chitinivorans DSM 11115]